MRSLSSATRLLLLLYLLYIGTFTLCCTYRPLKDISENYTKSDLDKTIKVQKTLQVRVIIYKVSHIYILYYYDDYE